jgi:hypothetical protein
MDPRLGTLPTHHPNYRAPRNVPFGKGKTVNYLCPFGCMDAKSVNDVGYCRHLAGFCSIAENARPGTKPSIGTFFEMRERTDVDKERVGHCLDKILVSDKLVPMKGETWRVYRKGGRYPMYPTAETTIREPQPEVEDGLTDEDMDDVVVETAEDTGSEAFVEAQRKAEETRKAKVEQARVKYKGKAAPKEPDSETPAPPG